MSNPEVKTTSDGTGSPAFNEMMTRFEAINVAMIEVNRLVDQLIAERNAALKANGELARALNLAVVGMQLLIGRAYAYMAKTVGMRVWDPEEAELFAALHWAGQPLEAKS